MGRRVLDLAPAASTISAILHRHARIFASNIMMAVRRRGDHALLRPTIGNCCDIGVGAVIVGGITVGDDSAIGVNVWSSRNQPPGASSPCPSR